MNRKRIIIQDAPADDTGPDTVDEGDLREFAKDFTLTFFGAERISAALAAALAAALPKPRLQVRPGMVLRCLVDISRAGSPDTTGARCLVGEDDQGMWMVGPMEMTWERIKDATYGLDPDEWTVLLDAEEAS